MNLCPLLQPPCTLRFKVRAGPLALCKIDWFYSNMTVARYDSSKGVVN